jgi:hypothetical protein
MTTMAELTGRVGFAHPTSRKSVKQRVVAIELMAMVGLVVSLVIAVTAVSIGIAHAGTLGVITDSDNGPFAVAVFLGLVMAGMGGLTALMARERTPPK